MPVDKLTLIRPKRFVRRATFIGTSKTGGRRLNCCYKPAHTNMGTKVPGYERSQERKFPRTFVLRERKFPGTKGPGNESSWNFHSWGTKVLHRDLSFLGTKGLGYEKSVIQIPRGKCMQHCVQARRSSFFVLSWLKLLG